MINDKIQITSSFTASLLAIAVVTGSMQILNAQENQTEVQESIQIEGIVDELLSVHPVRATTRLSLVWPIQIAL